MPKFSFAFQGFFRLLNRFRFKAKFETAKPVLSTSIKANNIYNIRQLSNSLPSTGFVSVTGRHPSLAPTEPLENHSPAAAITVPDDRMSSLETYLGTKGNLPVDIAKLKKLTAMPYVLLEIGCGTCEVALEIALKNPDWAVIATDIYAWDVSTTECSHYQKLAQNWKTKQLKVQQAIPANLVILRTEAEVLRFLPDRSIDSILLVNPEPLVGQAFLALLSEHPVYAKIKPGARQIVIVPFSREMGVGACGGYEFDHSEDWSRGLGFIKSSGFNFRKADKVQWNVDLRGSSPYSKNSTQTDVYLYGNCL